MTQELSRLEKLGNEIQAKVDSDNEWFKADMKRLEEVGNKMVADMEVKLLNQSLMMMCQ